MFFGLIHRVEPLEKVLDREREHLFAELLDQALGDQEITSAAAQSDLSIANLRATALNSRDEVLRSAAAEEVSVHFAFREEFPDAYRSRHWAGPHELWEFIQSETFITFRLIAFLGSVAGAIWLLIYGWTGSWLWASGAALGGVIASSLAFYALDSPTRRPGDNIAFLFMALFCGSGAAYTGYQIGSGWFSLASAAALTGLVLIFIGTLYLDSDALVRISDGVQRYIPTPTVRTEYDKWQRTVLEGVFAYLRGVVNDAQLSRYSTVLSVWDAPGLRYLGDVRYHVPTASRDELMYRLASVDGGSFALAGPRGAGKTILLRALCDGRYGDDSLKDLGVVVSAPVEYQARDFVLYLYTEVCKATKEYFVATVAPARQRFFRRIDATREHAMIRRANQKLRQIRYLQSFSAEVSAKGGVKFAELSAKAATSMAEQPLTYPEIVADLRNFLQTVADSVDGRLLIGIDELDRIGSGERARKFLDDIKAIFWVRGCYFLVSVSEDALRAFELTGHGLRDAFDSAFDEVIVVEHLDFDASTTLLRARVTGMPLPYHALAYCLSGGLPRELMRSARAIVDQRTPDSEVKLGQVTANLVTNELARHNRAARLALADSGEGAGKAAEFLRRLDEGCRPTDEGLRGFADEIAKATDGCSETIHSLALAVATHAHYLAALAAVFSDQLAEEDIRRATDSDTPVEGQFSTLARARRYLGVNDAFARMLVNGFRTTWH